MIASKKKDKSLPKQPESIQEPQKQLRRSSRTVKVKCDDDFLIGHDQLDQYIGRDPSQDDHGAKRARKSYYYDEMSDFSDNHRSSRKRYSGSQNIRRVPLLNPIQGLLKWRDEIENIPMPEPTKENSQVIKVKNICKEPLEKHAQGIEALFINIEWDKKNKKIQDVKNLKINSLKFMPKGLVFIWTPKEHISDVIELMEEKGFNYVENLEIGIFDRQKAYEIHRTKRGILSNPSTSDENSSRSNKPKQAKKAQKQETEDLQEFPLHSVIASLQNINPNDLIHRTSSEYFNRSKKTLYIFRRNTDQKLQLRHQRTCDVVFDMPKNPQGKCEPELKNYLFLMIETMLPKCLEFEKSIKMMELWGDNDSRRRGWITMVEQ